MTEFIVKICLRPGWIAGKALEDKIEARVRSEIIKEGESVEPARRVDVMEFRADGFHKLIGQRIFVGNKLVRG